MKHLAAALFILTGFGHEVRAQFPGGPRYGKGCGIAGVDPDQRYAMETLIEYRDTAGIFGWLHDKEPVLQAYALEALIRLQRKGLVVPRRELARMATLKRSKQMVSVCSGCSTWEMPLNEAVEMFTKTE